MSSRARLAAADDRDARAEARDEAAVERDHTADARDAEMAPDDAADEPTARRRDLAAEDRRAAADDHESSAGERVDAHADREALAGQLQTAETDPLTGARARAAGLAELDLELDRVRRGDGQLVVAYVDVIGLKHRNDTEGHAAGDALLTGVVALIRGRLRSYDLVVRLGGDEFLFVMSNMTLAEGQERLGAVSDDDPASGILDFSVGFAELEPGDTAASLIARADDELTDRRRHHRDSRSAPVGPPD